MRALTLKQPWASAVMYGPKRVENRAKRTVPKAWELPVWVAIHAGQSRDKDADRIDFRGWGWEDWSPTKYGWASGLLGVARIDGVSTGRDISDTWSFGPWCIRIGEVIALDEPIQCSGMLGFWSVERALVKHGAAALAEYGRLRALVPSEGRIPA